MDVRWGLIGASGYGAAVAVPAIVGAEGARLAGVLSSERAKAAALAAAHDVPLATDDLGELLAGEIDAVWIATPTHLHHPMAVAALEAGKHVLLEKPLALRSQDAWELVEAAAKADRLLATGYQARYVAGHIEMRRLIASGEIGAVSAARTFWGIQRDGPPQAWRQRIDQAGWGVLGDIGTHHVDLLRMLLGEVESAVGLTAYLLGYGTEDVASAALRFTGGAVASLTVSASVAAVGTLVEVFGSAGTLRATNTSPGGGGSVTLERPGEAPVELHAGGPPSPQLQVEAVSRAIAGEDVEYCTGADGARNLEVLEEIVATTA
jgi:1,5-anhydro-D-fructose reductase (1,5-anhydro-D-mannitol-forming)